MSKVSEIMSTRVQVVAPDDTLMLAAQRMQDWDVGALPVSDGERLLGMVTDRDITVRGVATGLPPQDSCVSDVMSRGAQFCTTDQESQEVLQLMAQNRIRRLPVLDSQSRLVGIVSLGDLALRQSAPIEQTVRAISEPTSSMPG